MARSHSFGYDSTRVSNLQMLDKDIIAYVAGAFLVIQNIKHRTQKYLQTTGRVCFGTVTVSRPFALDCILSPVSTTRVDGPS